MTSAETIKLFNRCNVSEDLIKRFSNVCQTNSNGNRLYRKISSLSPTGKKVALEQILLSVPLDADVANFSDSGGKNNKSLNVPLYSDHYEPSFCLPSSGYKSDNEGSRYRIRTYNSADNSPEKSPGIEKKEKSTHTVRRTRSLNASTVTDRIFEIREKLAKSKHTNNKSTEKGNDVTNPSRFGFRSNNTQSNSVLRSRSFNKIRTIEDHQSKLKSSSVTTVNLRSSLRKNNTEERPNENIRNEVNEIEAHKTNSNKESSASGQLRSSSFNTLQDAWEHRKSNRTRQDSKHSDIEIKVNQTPLSDVENGVIYRRRERRRLKRAGHLHNLPTERSDSETDQEDGQLTQAALQRLERRNHIAARRSSSFARRRANHDENNNDINGSKFETSSDKTLDSGIFDSAVSSLSEDISKLSRQYNSFNFVLDDCLSPKSGYSSATESLAESLAGSYYDSTDDNLDMENRKKRNLKFKTKPDKTNAKTAVLNAASRLAKEVTGKISSTDTKLNMNLTPSLMKQQQTLPTNDLSNTAYRINKDLTSHTPTSITSNHEKNNSEKTIKNDRKSEQTEKKLIKSHSLNKKQLASKQTSESSLLRKESIHSKTCNGPERMAANNNSNFNSLNKRKDSIKTNQRKISFVDPAAKKDEVKPKLAKTCVSPTLLNNKEGSHIGLLDDKDNLQQIEGGTDHSIIKQQSQDQHTSEPSKNINHHVDAHTENKFSTDKPQETEAKMDSTKGTLRNFSINRARSSIDEGNSRNRLLRQGDSIELSICLDDLKPSRKVSKPFVPAPIKLTPAKEVVSPHTSTKQTVSPQTSTKQISTLNECNKRVSSNDKSIQCLLLSGETVLCGEVIEVSDTSKKATINKEIIDNLGCDILKDIQFTYPAYLIDKLDTTDFPDNTEKLDPVKLHMENVRLQQLLFEVEKARAGSVKALLHVNTLFNKIQGENTKLESDLKVCLQEKDLLTENLQTFEKQAETKTAVDLPKDSSGKTRRNTVDHSLSIIVGSWKKEKKDLLSQLTTSKTKEENAEKAATRLRIQYKKVKEQLEHSNNAFTMTLTNNLQATKRMEEELKSSIDDKQELLKKCDEGNKISRQFELLKQEIEELKAAHEELQDENEQMEKKCAHLEKKKKQLQMEEEELHEQIGHSQEIIEKLSDVEEQLKAQLQLEITDKEYLSECLEETGQILYQLKNNEVNLLKDKDTLLDDLEAEVEEKESLQTTLSRTMNDHKDLVDRLQNMTNIHVTVKESLHQANRKEKNYQEQIEALTKTNHILHYSLEKEREERTDLQEMFEIIEMDHKKFKTENVSTLRDLEMKVEQLQEETLKLTEMKDTFEKKCSELQANLEQEEDENSSLRQQLSRLEKLKQLVDQEVSSLRVDVDGMEKNIDDLKTQCKVLEAELKSEKQNVEKVTCNLEETEELLDTITKELNETKQKLDESRSDFDDATTKLKDRQQRLKEMGISNGEATEQRDKYFNRMNYYETETKELRKKVSDQIEEIGTLQIESQRLSRERDTHKRNCDMSVADFEAHKAKCTENLKKLKDEIISLSTKIVEKDRLSMKQKEYYQGQIDYTQSDLQFLRKMLDGDIRKNKIVKKNSSNSNSDDLSGSESIDLNYIRNTHDKFRDEFQSHVTKLEDMLKDSKETSDTITVVQSPMSRIKLEEIKELRNEIFDLNEELKALKTKATNIFAEITSFKTPRNIRIDPTDSQDGDLEANLANLNELITKIECRHQAVMSRNAVLLQRTLTEDDRTAKDLVKKFQVISLEGENKQLKSLLEILKKKYDFNEQELAIELKPVEKVDVSKTVSAVSGLCNGTTNYSSDGSENTLTPRSHMPTKSDSIHQKIISPENESNSRYNSTIPTRSASTRSGRTKNNSLFNEMVSSGSDPLPAKKYAQDLHLRSSGVSSYSSDDDEDDFSPPRLSKRYNTLPSRGRKPRT